MEIRLLMQTIRSLMEQEFGKRLKGVVLFGSYARGEQRDDSDIDVLVLLNGPIKLSRDIGRIVDRVYHLTLLDPEHPVHAIPVDADDYAAGACALYRRVAAEGIVA